MDRLFAGVFLGTIALGLITLALLWTPVMGPWTQERRGIADLREAQQNRQILVEQAEAQRQVAILKAEGEREASKIRAEAIRIIGQAAKDFPEYRNQEFIGAFADALKDGSIHQVIYVPTEANIPILEAGRR
ncbi:hypothetical protein [Pseudophaeobacter sp.]|uniref:hypothetical protein n=1 Tax=Pseudophaeobacter sp. TaxID=1971739 RepID=UPI00329786F0